ncbi:MAG: oligosaccharide flippase family protein [Gammaproteobacteria bacterium]|nr:oligosaccharide flippase family protein [Gammaproteobacteria bacterium]
MNLIKNNIWNVLLYGCGLVVVNGLSFLMLPFYTRQFSPAEYAVIVLIFVCLPFTRYTLPLEVCQAAPIFSADDEKNSSQYISTGFWFTLLINIQVCIYFYIANNYWHFLDLSSFHLITIFILLTIDCLFYFTSNILRWQLKPFKYNAIIASAAILEVVLTINFVLNFHLGIFGVFYAWILSRLTGLLFVFLYTKQFYTLSFNFRVLKKMLFFSAPLALSNLSYNLNRAFDRWIIGNLIGLTAVGIYGAGATIGGVISFIMASLSAALSPIIYKNHENKDSPVQILRLFYLVLILCMVVAMSLVLFNKDILHILVSPIYYRELADQSVVPIIMLTTIVSGLHIFSPGLSIKKKTHYIIWFNLISFIVNVSLAYLLIMQFNITGVAFATMLSVLVNTLLYMVYGQKFYKLPFRSSHLISLALLFSSFYAGAIWLGKQDSLLTWQGVFIKSTYGLLFFSLSLVLFLRINKSLTGSLQRKHVFAYQFAEEIQ